MKCLFELPEIVIRPQTADASPFGLGFLDASGGRQRQGRNGVCVNMRVRLLSATNGKFGGLLDSAQPQQGERPRTMYRKQHRIKWTEMSCGVSRVHRPRGIADLAVH